MAKNYLIIRTEGKKMYSTSIRAYKIVNNIPVEIGELHGQGHMETNVGFLNKIVAATGSTVNIKEKYQAGEITIHDINL